MIDVEAGIEIMGKELLGIEETVDLGIDEDPPLRINVKRNGVITVENQGIL